MTDDVMNAPPLAAKIVLDGDLYWFASLDGENWIEVGDDPRLSTRAALDAHMNPKTRGTVPMRIARRFLRHHHAEFLP